MGSGQCRTGKGVSRGLKPVFSAGDEIAQAEAWAYLRCECNGKSEPVAMNAAAGNATDLFIECTRIARSLLSGGVLRSVAVPDCGLSGNYFGQLQLASERFIKVCLPYPHCIRKLPNCQINRFAKIRSI